MTGKTLGRYRVLDQLGAGGMGVVYKAEDTSLERTVVIKVIGEQLAADSTARARLLREAKTASALNHPNICTIFEVGEAEGRPYIAMEFIAGRTLGESIRSGLTDGEVSRLAVQIVEALAHAHEHGVVHRDLKSANVLVTPQGLVKVLDFGLAKRTGAGDSLKTVTQDQLTQAGTVVGTLAYMAPELLKGAAADVRSDLWALGVMLYEMLAGALPFRGTTVFETTSAILREELPPLPASVAASWRGVVARLLEKDPAVRYQSAGEVRGALRAMESVERAAPAAGPPPSRRRIVGVAVGSAVAAAGGLGLFRWSRSTGPTVASGGPASASATANAHFNTGFFHLTRTNDIAQAQREFEKAVQLDPKFAEARAWYGFTFGLLFDFGLSSDPSLFYRAEKEIQQALADDPNLARGYSGLAGVFFWQRRKDLMPGAIDRALRLNPDDVDALVWQANYHQYNGDYAAAEASLRRVLKNDPLFMPAFWGLAEFAFNRGDLDAARAAYEKALEPTPRDPFLLAYTAHLQMARGKLPEARALLDRVPAERRDVYHVRMMRGILAALEGRPAEARKEVDDGVLKIFSVMLQYMYLAAEYFTALKETSTALDWLERAAQSGDERTSFFRVNPLLAEIRGDPRFAQILESAELRRKQRAR